MSQRIRRQQMIADLLTSEPCHSQEQIQDLLAARGISATQATVSRDLRELNVLKGHDGYTLPETGRKAVPTQVGRSIEQVFKTYVTSLELAGNLIVMKTGPGQAQLVAAQIDRTPPAGVVGTVAGDDTIFMAVRTTARAESLIEELTEVAELGVLE